MNELRSIFTSTIHPLRKCASLPFLWIALFSFFHHEPMEAKPLPFDFRSFTAFAHKTPLFLYYNGASPIGEGKIDRLDPNELQITFFLHKTGRGRTATIRLLFEGETDGTLFFLFSVAGGIEQIPPVQRTRVGVPAFLIENGILSFHYEGAKRFFQLSRDKKGGILVINEGRIFLRQR